MLYPSINEIKHKADSRYTLVILAAKRARDLVDGKPALVNCRVNKPVSIAAKEINEDMIKVRYPEDKPQQEEEAEEAEETAEEEAEESEEAAEEEAEAGEGADADTEEAKAEGDAEQAEEGSDAVEAEETVE